MLILRKKKDKTLQRYPHQKKKLKKKNPQQRNKIKTRNQKTYMERSS